MPSAMASRHESVSWQQAERMRERSGRRASWRRPVSLQAAGQDRGQFGRRWPRPNLCSIDFMPVPQLTKVLVNSNHCRLPVPLT